tara:strand:- start:23184 stop:23807 length:624 start_codon:yes stop_codon:yes gene_type:complete
MPLTPPVDREQLHTRKYDFNGYLRRDGLWDIEGRITDVKSYDFDNDFRGTLKAGDPLHDMWLRVTLDNHFKIHDIEAVTDGSPYELCPNITPNFKRMIGASIGPGWRKVIHERLGGVHGCTHLVEMLQSMGTVAFQTLYPARIRQERARKKKEAEERRENGLPDIPPPPAETPKRRPPLLNSCHAFASDSPVVKATWPDFYSGPEKT